MASYTPRRNDPVKRRWLIIGGTIVALAAGGGGSAGIASAADDDGERGARPAVERSTLPSDAVAPTARLADPESLASRLARLAG